VECPYCGSDSRVLDSRGSTDAVRRRRECLECGRRFTTYERLAPPEIRVAKRDGGTEPFDRDKLVRIVKRVTRDRGVTPKAAEDLARGLEAELVDAGAQVVTTSQVADRLLTRLRELDALAASRFASNYTQEDGTIRTSVDEPSPQLALFGGAPAAAVDEPEAQPPVPPKRKKR
jgi:transcriptional repressor NrdR